MDKKQEAELRQKHGDLVIARVAGKEFAFATPTQTDYEQLVQSIAKVGSSDKVKLGPTFREFCLKSVVFPDDDAVGQLEGAFQKQPAAATTIANALQDLAGADVEVSVKKA